MITKRISNLVSYFITILKRTRDLPSKGFINASLEMVAAAPATAVPTTPCHPSFLPPLISLTNSYIPKCAACAGPAPRMTLATPRQRERSPSVVEMERTCWEMVLSWGEIVPVMVALVVPVTGCKTGARICIRVFGRLHWRLFKTMNAKKTYLDGIYRKNGRMFRYTGLF